jgi:hypothetical protein
VGTVGALVHTSELSPKAATNVAEVVASPLPSAPFAPLPAQRVSPVVQETKQTDWYPTAIALAGLESKRTAGKTLPVEPSCESWLWELYPTHQASPSAFTTHLLSGLLSARSK